MKSKQIALIIIGAVILIAFFTNPSQATHKEKVKSTISVFYQKQLKENESTSSNTFGTLGSLLGTTLINTMVETGVSCDNYLVFSITKMTYNGQVKSIGFGTLGNVFLSNKIEEAFNKKY